MRTLLTLFVGLVLGWLFLPMPPLMCGAFRSDAAPAWVQAIGSVAAIFIAAGIPMWQERLRDRERRKRLSISTLRLRSNLEALGASATAHAATLRGFDSSRLTPDGIEEVLFRTILWEAPQVESRIDQIHDLDRRIVAPILGFLAEYDQHNIERERVRLASKDEIVALFNLHRNALIGRMEKIGELAFKASMAIRTIDEESRYPDIKARNLGGRP